MPEGGEQIRSLISRAGRGDKAAFETLYRMYMIPIYRYTHARLKNKDDAEDVVQEVFTRAYAAMGRYEDKRETMLPYLFTIARNLIINMGKKKRADTMLPEEIDRHSLDLADPEREAMAGEERRALYIALEKLPDADRAIIELRFFAEYSYPEIAAILGKREDAVRQSVARAIKKLRATMGTHATT